MILIAALTIAVMIANMKRLPIAHVVWFLTFLILGLTARRNVVLIGPVIGYLLAWNGGEVISRIVDRRGKLSRAGPYLTGWMVAVALLCVAATGTSWIWDKLGSNQQLGAGLRKQHYPIAAAKFLRDLPGRGDVFCENFGDAAAFAYYAHPKRRIFMDGRLEAYSLERFKDHFRIANSLRTPEAAQAVRLPPEIRFIYIRHGSPRRLSAAMQARRFTLIHFDPVGACFARADWVGTARGLPSPNFEDYDRPLTRENLVEGFAAEKRRFYAQNPPALNFRFASMLLAMGAGPRADITQMRCTLLGIRYLNAARTEDIAPSHLVTAALAWGYHQRALQCDVAPSARVPVDINSARALALYDQLDLTRLDDRDIRMSALHRIIAMKDARAIDAADEAVRQFLANLPPREQVLPPQAYLQLRDTIRRALDEANARASQLRKELTLGQRIDLLTSPRVGLIRRAIGELQTAADTDPQARMRLGDLLLRTGSIADAKSTYATVKLTPQDAWELALRDALCEWAEGKLHEAGDALGKLARQSDEPLVSYYHAVLLEQIGRYDEARATIAAAHTDAPVLGPLIKRIRQRLEFR